MEKHMPGFVLANATDYEPPTYHNGRCNESWLAQYASSAFSSGQALPCAGVSIYEDPESTDTLIRVWLNWPAP
jgi:hypothetical protein